MFKLSIIFILPNNMILHLYQSPLVKLLVKLICLKKKICFSDIEKIKK